MQFVKSMAWLIAAIILQQTLVRLIGVQGARPDFILIALIAISLRHGHLYGLYGGLLIGLIQDVYAIESLGANALAKALVGYLIGQLDERTVKIMPVTKVLLLGTGFVVHDLLYTWFIGLTGTAYVHSLLRFSIPSFIYTLLIAAFIYTLMPTRSRIQEV
jgi:rod shape-determining protein MreD